MFYENVLHQPVWDGTIEIFLSDNQTTQFMKLHNLNECVFCVKNKCVIWQTSEGQTPTKGYPKTHHIYNWMFNKVEIKVATPLTFEYFMVLISIWRKIF